MKIAHFIADDVNQFAPRGVPRSVYYTALYLKKQAPQAEVAVFCIPKEKSEGPENVQLFTYKEPRVPFMLPAGLAEDLDRWKPDILHMHSMYTPVLTRLSAWARRHKIPYIHTPRGATNPNVMKRNTYLKYPYKWLFELHMLNNAIFIHALTDGDDIRNYGVTAPIVEIPNGFLMEEVPTDLNDKWLVEKYPQVEGKRVFVFLGRLDPLHKGLDLLIEAWARLKPDNAIMLMAGPDFEGSIEQLKQQASQYGFGDQWIFTGPIYGEDKYHMFASSDVFVHTTRWEGGYPHSMMEASACNLPCLLTFAPDRTKLWNEHGASVHVELDVDDIARGLGEFIDMDEAKLKEMGHNSYELIRTQFDWNIVAKRILDAYEKYGNTPSSQ